VKVIAAPHEQWPFPWYARELTQVGYWTAAAEAGALDGVPVILASQQEAESVAAAVGDRYVSEFYGLRPNVLITLFVEPGLWKRFLAARQSAP
jgi:predicted membrane-bound mannosyltransferase